MKKAKAGPPVHLTLNGKKAECGGRGQTTYLVHSVTCRACIKYTTNTRSLMAVTKRLALSDDPAAKAAVATAAKQTIGALTAKRDQLQTGLKLVNADLKEADRILQHSGWMDKSTAAPSGG